MSLLNFFSSRFATGPEYYPLQDLGMEDSKEIRERDDGFGSASLDESPSQLAPADFEPTDPSAEVTKKRQSLSDIFTIFCAGFALISDGYQNNLMTMTNVVLKAEYKKQYTSRWSTQVSNALLVGEILGQITIGRIHWISLPRFLTDVLGLTCDYMGRKTAIVVTTLMIVIGGILATASSGTTIYGMFWMLSTFISLA